MTLLVLTYHRARAGRDGNSPAMLDAHFQHIAAQYENVLPGERLPAARDSVCLCFDGGTFDFYATVFPLLLKRGLRAVLAVAPAVIREDAAGATSTRLELPTSDAHGRLDPDAYCTWRELDELVRSDLVTVAAQGYSPCALNEASADLETEIHVPRTLLGARLHVTVDSFVFPFGKYTRSAVDEAKFGYEHVFADGNAANSNWNVRLLRRIRCDDLITPAAPFTPARRALYRAASLWYRLRN